ncbi:MAG: RNA polymerase sigma factor [Fibrobacteres bacterium]|jgi:RNA polymerase sigma factor (sigma-70 family)|nr:RNA polymerase sigma factor [Fibrobacterota bacterium]
MDTEDGIAGALGEGNQALSPEAVRLFTENHLRFLNFLRRHVQSDVIAEDLLQQAILNAVRHGKDWDEKENSLAWFYRILRNQLTDHYRKRASEQRKMDALRLEAEQSGLHPESAEDRNQLCGCFEGLLPSLKGEYADLIRRIDLGGEDPASVASGLGISYNNLSVRLHRARNSLRSSLEKTCGICTRHGCLDCTCVHPKSQGPKPV